MLTRRDALKAGIGAGFARAVPAAADAGETDPPRSTPLVPSASVRAFLSIHNYDAADHPLLESNCRIEAAADAAGRWHGTLAGYVGGVGTLPAPRPLGDGDLRGLLAALGIGPATTDTLAAD